MGSASRHSSFRTVRVQLLTDRLRIVSCLGRQYSLPLRVVLASRRSSMSYNNERTQIFTVTCPTSHLLRNDCSTALCQYGAARSLLVTQGASRCWWSTYARPLLFGRAHFVRLSQQHNVALIWNSPSVNWMATHMHREIYSKSEYATITCKDRNAGSGNDAAAHTTLQLQISFLVPS